jgi:hypothetical protein
LIQGYNAEWIWHQFVWQSEKRMCEKQYLQIRTTVHHTPAPKMQALLKLKYTAITTYMN